MIVALVLAAGAARRFGGRKMLAEVQGTPLLSMTVAAVEGAVDAVVVVTGSDANAVEAMLRVAHPRITCVRAEGWAEGMGASLSAGVRSLDADPQVRAVMVVLGDQPLVPRVVREVAMAWRASPVDLMRTRYDDGAGHPVIFARSQFGALMALRGDAGARALIGSSTRVTDVVVGGERPPDVDRPEDIAALPPL